MKLQRTPLLLLAVAFLLGAFVYLYEVQGKPQRDAAKAQTEQLFAFQESDVRSLNLTTPTQTLSFAKTPAARLTSAPKQGQKSSPKPDQTTPQGTGDTLIWAMTAPDAAVANDASIAYLLNLFATGKRQQTITVPAARKAEFGLDTPTAIAEVKLANQQIHRLILGKPNFNHSALYAQVDPPAQSSNDLSIALVSTDFENAVKRPLAEWKEKTPELKQSPAPKQPDSKK